jgi:PhnB protein
MSLNPYLYFDGQCEEAFKFYEKCLGGKITFMMTWEGSPMPGQARRCASSRFRSSAFHQQ